jgi:hypothetical protein
LQPLQPLHALSQPPSPSFGKALQKAASQDLPVLSLVSITAYLCHKKWLFGIAGDIGGGALTLVALAYAPISVVQPVMCSGMGMSALIAAFYLHEAIAPPDWFSTFLILLGRHYSPLPLLPPLLLPLCSSCFQLHLLSSFLVALSHTDHSDQRLLFSASGLFILGSLIAAFLIFLLSRRRLFKHISPLLSFLDKSVPAAAIRCRTSQTAVPSPARTLHYFHQFDPPLAQRASCR